MFSLGSAISARAHALIDIAFRPGIQRIQLSIPSIVFVEVFAIFLHDEESTAKFYYEVMTRILDSPNIEIRELDREVLERMLDI